MTVKLNFTISIFQWKKKVLLLSLLSILFHSLLTSQNNQLQNFNTKEGLPQSQVYDIVQDSIGYLWLATQGGGLARFDGDSFDVFNEKSGLKSNFANTLLVSNDSLFIGTFSGLSVYAKGKFTNYESPRVNKIISLDHRKHLATEKGIYAFEKDSLFPIQSITKIDLDDVTDISKSGASYLVATQKGLWVLDQLENPKSADKIDTSHYTSLIKKDDLIYASTYDDGIKIIQNGKIVGNPYRDKKINSMTSIGDDLWLAMDAKGIIILDNRFRKQQEINQGNGLAINQIQSIFKDKQENIWIGSLGGGLYKLTQNSFQHFDRNSGLRGNRIYAVHKKDDAIWISTSEKGISKIDSLGIKHIFNDNGYLNVKATTIASDPYHNIWVGTEGKGILVFKRKYLEKDSNVVDDSKFNRLKKELFPDYILETDTITMKDGLSSDLIKKIIIKDKSIWVATNSAGIVELIYGKGGSSVKVWDYYGTTKGIRDPNINDLQDDVDGKLWYVTKGGNLGYIYNNKARGFYQILGKEISITTIEIRENNIYLGTLGDGIWVVNKQNPRELKPLSGVKELNSKNIYQLIFDNENNLWAGTEKGVNKIVLDENNAISDVFYFDRSDGFLGIETCLNAVDKDSQGNIWFGTMNGLTKYIPTKSQSKKVQPTVHLETVEVAYQTLDSVDVNNFSEVLQLKPSENHLSFRFKSVDINHPKGIEYQWTLNDNVSPWTSKDFIDFGNLNNGNYEFSIKARNIDWVESDPIQFEFFIDQPLYKKSWFLATVYSSAALIVLIIILMISRRTKRKNKQKVAQLEMENHLLSLEQKALQLQMNPHFIFNVLNGIKAMGHEGETEQMNTTINTFATLLRSILNSSRQEEISLKEEIATLQNYLTLEQQMTAHAFEFDIQHDTQGIDIEEILVPPMLIQPFVENSVKHGFQHNAIQGKITISFHVKDDFLECEIRDNGIGIEQSKLKKKHHHPSTALKVTRERIESLSKEHQLKIAEDNGIIVSFRLPLKTDY